MAKTLLQLLAENHITWLKMARSFKKADATSFMEVEDIVQEMYLLMDKYVKTPERIMFNETEINTQFVYTVLRNIYYKDYNSSKKLNSMTTDDTELEEHIEEIKTEEYHINLQKLEAVVNEEIESWHHYDSRVFKLIYYDGISMRKLSRESGISLTSIFNTIKSCRAKIKERLDKDNIEYYE